MYTGGNLSLAVRIKTLVAYPQLSGEEQISSTVFEMN